MPIDLVGAIVGWLIATAGDAGVRLIRGPDRERELRRATRHALRMVVEQVDPAWQQAFSAGLEYCFASPLRLRPDSSMRIGPWFRAAITEQLSQLDEWINPDTGRSFYHDIPVDPEWLRTQIVDRLIGALRQVAATSGLTDLVHGLDVSDVLDQIESLGRQIGQLAVTSVAVATRSLPRDIASFTGRSAELAFVKRRVEHAESAGGIVGIHAIDGMAGIGKTAFAIHAAHQLSSRFPDGQIFLPLHAHTPGRRPVESGEALTSLLLTMGIAAQQIPVEVEARARLWRHHLADKSVLIVLDDASGHEQVRPLLPAGPRTLVIVTSRRRLTALEDAMEITLDVFSMDDATTLLARLASRSDLDASDASTREIARMCGFLPLAIGMMARQLGTHSAWTVSDLASELASTRDHLALMQSENLSVAAAFDLSYQELSPDEQRLFRRLGLQPGTDTDPYAMAALGEIDFPSSRHFLEKLYNHHLIAEPSRGRYRFHDLVREHAQSLASTDDPTEQQRAVDRLLDYYLHTATIANHHLTRRSPPNFPPVSQPPGWVPDLSTPAKAADWMEYERSNLDAVVEYAALKLRSRHAVEIPAVISGFLCTRGFWAQAAVLHETAIETARDVGDLHGEAVALNQLGHLQRLRSDYQTAIATQEQALELSRSIGDIQCLANACDSLGVVHYLRGEYSSARDNLTRALELYRESADQLGQAEVLLHLGAEQQATGDYAAAIATLTEALVIQRSLGHALGEAESLNYLGVIQHLTGKYRESIDTLTLAIELQRKLNDHLGEAEVRNNLGAVLCETGDYRQAIDNLRDSFELYEDLGNRRGRASVLTNISQVLIAIGDLNAAIATAVYALQQHQDLGNQRGQGNTLRCLGVARYRTGEYQESAIDLRESVRIFRELGDRRGQAEALNNLGDVLSDSSAPRSGRALHEEALSIARDIGVQLEEAHALQSIAHICLSEGDYHNGAAHLAESLGILEQLNSGGTFGVPVRHWRSNS